MRASSAPAPSASAARPIAAGSSLRTRSASKTRSASAACAAVSRTAVALDLVEALARAVQLERPGDSAVVAHRHDEDRGRTHAGGNRLKRLGKPHGVVDLRLRGRLGHPRADDLGDQERGPRDPAGRQEPVLDDAQDREIGVRGCTRRLGDGAERVGDAALGREPVRTGRERCQCGCAGLYDRLRHPPEW